MGTDQSDNKYRIKIKLNKNINMIKIQWDHGFPRLNSWFLTRIISLMKVEMQQIFFKKKGG